MFKLVKSADGFDTSDMSYFTNFDFLNDSLEYYRPYLRTIYKDDRFLLRLSYFGYNAMQSLYDIVDSTQLDHLFMCSQYKCIANGYTHYSVLPVGILTTPEQGVEYIKMKNNGEMPWYTKMATDPTWWTPQDIGDPEEFEEKFLMARLGPGYTYGKSPSDGSSETAIYGIDLDNGDTVLFIMNLWYNK